MSGYPPPTPNRQRDADRSHSLKFTGRMGKKKSTTLFIQKTHVTLSYMGHYLLSLSLYFPLRFNGISHYLLFRTATCCHRALPFLSQ